MPKMVIEIREELRGLGEALLAIVSEVQGTVARTGGGKAVNYAEAEVAVAGEAAKAERAAHQAILQSLDIDVPAVIIGGIRHTKVGRCSVEYTRWPDRCRSSGRCTVYPALAGGSHRGGYCHPAAIVLDGHASRPRVEVLNLHLGRSARQREQQVALLARSALVPDVACLVGGDFSDWRP